MIMEERRKALIADVGTAIQEYQRGVDAVDEAIAVRLGVNRTDLRTLDVLFNGPQPAGELAAQVGLSPAAMTTALDRLEKKGLVRRIRDAADRRKVFVEMTDEAQRLTWETIGPLVEEGEQVLEPFSDEDLVKVARFLRATREAGERHVSRIQQLPKHP